MSTADAEMGKGVPRSFQRTFLLIALAGGSSHGYDLLDAVRRMGLRSAEAGGLYRGLRSMEEEELVSSWWEPSQAGPPRRTYLLTALGREALDAAVESLSEIHGLLATVLDGCAAAVGATGR